MAATVETVRGPVPIAELGTTLMHEHIFVLTPDSQANWLGEWDEEDKVADAVSKLQALRDQGVTTIVDPTVDGLGRNVARVARINAEVDINIIVATGVYTYHEVPHFFSKRGPGIAPGLEDPMVDLFVRDIREGVQGTGVKAAFLKCAIDEPGLTGGVERIMRAVAKAHVETGAPIMVHTHPATHTGLEVDKVMGDEGVEPSAVLLAHCGDLNDADHLCDLADRGYLLGMDRFGIELLVPFEERVGIVVELCRRGYGERMVLSHDASCYIDWLAPELTALVPSWNYLHILDNVVPALRERDVSDNDIEAMLVGNPRRWFEHNQPR